MPEAGTCVSHGQRRATLAVLGIGDILAGSLHTAGEAQPILGRKPPGCAVLREERHDRLAGIRAAVAPDHWHSDGLDRLSCCLMHELVRADCIEGRDPADFCWVKALVFIDQCHGRNHRREGIHDETNHSIRAEFCACLNYVPRDAPVDLHEITLVPTPARHPQCGQNQGAACQALLQMINGFLPAFQRVRLDLAPPLEVPQVNPDALCRHHRYTQVVD
mmetsp:Transcript_55551/g.119910  ORF Transcript_55551/g.119910 Transcript_55551/m.119910 type:complete len:219 (+) Transcript_55551:456-1112(+)